jgi:hypothetical protein
LLDDPRVPIATSVRLAGLPKSATSQAGADVLPFSRNVSRGPVDAKRALPEA